MTIDFTGLVAVVTGAGRGLGRRYALDLGARGAHVVVTARRAGAAGAVVDEIHAAGGSATPCAAEAVDGETPVRTALEVGGRLDALVVNAGQVRDRSFGRMNDDEWGEVLAVHLDGARAITRAAWAVMRSHGSGRIVLTGSGAGLHGNVGQANYAAAKAGIIGLGRTLALEGARHGIGVNVVAPMARTDMTEAVFDDAQRTALTAERVSPVVVALAHPSCPLSGQIIETGGGRAAALRWERSAGIRLDGDHPTPEEVADRWGELVDFAAGADHPRSTVDSLALGTRPSPTKEHL